MLLVRVIVNDDEARRLAFAWATILPGGIASLLLAERSRGLPSTKRVVYIAAGHPIRLLSTLLIALAFRCVILSVQAASFWLWIVVTYALSLAGDVWLTLRVIQAESKLESNCSTSSHGLGTSPPVEQ